MPEALRPEYEEKEGSFTLRLEGHEDVLIPVEKKNLAEQHRREAEKNLADAQKREKDLLEKLEKADNSKEIEKIRQQHQADLDKIKTEFEEKDKANRAKAHQAMIQEEATKFVSKHFTAATSAVERLYAARLTVEDVDGQSVLRVLNDDGTRSVHSIDQLQKEILANEDFKPIIKASEASGGGASQGVKGTPGGAGSGKEVDLLSANKGSLTAAIRQKVEARK